MSVSVYWPLNVLCVCVCVCVCVLVCGSVCDTKSEYQQKVQPLFLKLTDVSFLK